MPNYENKNPMDDADRIAQMDEFAVRAWSKLDLKQLNELRDKLYNKISILSEESVTYRKQLEANLKDLDDYILIRQNRNNNNNNSNILV